MFRYRTSGLILLAMVVLTGLLPGAASAELAWDQRKVEIAAKVGQTEALAQFTFHNNGKQPVHIRSIRTSCGCTTAKLDKEQYQPGESGIITATFTFGDRVGLQHKTIVVETDEPSASAPASGTTSGTTSGAVSGGQAMVTLSMEVTIPELLRISPRYVYWRSDESLPGAGAVKTVKVQVVNAEPIEVTEVASSEPAFKTEVVTITKGKQYEVRITPTSDAKVDRARVTLTTKGPGDYVKQWTVHARVYREDAHAPAAAASNPDGQAESAAAASRQPDSPGKSKPENPAK